MLQRGLDVGQRAAPQPVVVVQVGIAHIALRRRAVARYAVHLEGRLAARNGLGHQIGVLGQVFQRGGINRGQDRRTGRLGGVHFTGQLPAAGPAEGAMAAFRQAGNAGIDHSIADGEDDAGIEGVEPPAGERRVEFLDAVPFMAHGLGASGLVQSFTGHCRPPRRSW